MYNNPFCLIKYPETPHILYGTGEIFEYSSVSEIDDEKEQFFVTPFCQAKEKGFTVQDDSKKIISLHIQDKKQISLDEFVNSFQSSSIEFEEDFKTNYNEEEYVAIAQDIIDTQIGKGEGSNFLIAQKVKGKVKDFSIEKMLTIMTKLFENDYGTYMTFLLYDGEHVFLGSSHEKQFEFLDGTITMNPISGTFLKNPKHLVQEGEFTKEMIKFLHDEKEISELFTVVDEELKLMTDFCDHGGMLIGPTIKEIVNVVYTEYHIIGWTDQKRLDLFKKAMRSPAVVGGPLENACRIISSYENEGRGYYGGAATYISDKETNVLKSAMFIRSFVFNIDGNFEAGVGSSIVLNSDPRSEYHEIDGKLSGMKNFLSGEFKCKERFRHLFAINPYILANCQLRNSFVSNIRLHNRKSFGYLHDFHQRPILVINNDDDFTNMLKAMFELMNFDVQIKKYNDVELEKLHEYELVCIGPGPGDPSDDTAKMLKSLKIIEQLETLGKKYFGICLGHQLICRYHGIKLIKKKNPTQGIQEEISLWGKEEKVGFYNTFEGVFSNQDGLPFQFSVGDDGTIHGMKSEKFFSFQFHPESLLSQNGVRIMERYIKELYLN